MTERDARFAEYESVIALASTVGLVLAAIFAGLITFDGLPGLGLAFLALLGWPFGLGMLAAYVDAGVGVRRGLLLAAAIAAASSTVFAPTGVAVLLGIIAVVYGWVWWQSDEKRG